MPAKSRARLLVLMPLAVLLVVATAEKWGEGPRPLCQVAADWAKDHRGTLPTSLAEISKYDMFYRKAIYHELSFPQRRELWREHLSGFLRPDVKLTDEQRSMVEYTVDHLETLVVPEAEAKKAHAAAGLEPTHLESVFGDSLAHAIFATLGPEDPPRLAIPKDSTTSGKPLDPCTCSTGSDWCTGIWNTCISVLCGMTDSGCGTLWCWACVGQCGFVE